MDYELILKFDSKQGDYVYIGESYYKKNLIDRLSVSPNEIRLSFTRKKKVDAQTFLYTANSVYRYELQRALSFYLVVFGSFPCVKEMVLQCADGPEMIEHESFSDTWRNCNLKCMLPADVAKDIFINKSYSKKLYIAITYFIKAQLDKFSNDCFRAAWSGFNALYRNDNHSDERERDALEKICKKIRGLNMPTALREIEKLDKEFIKSLDWYSFIRNNTKQDIYNKLLDANFTKDSTLLKEMVSRYEAAGIDVSEYKRKLQNTVAKNNKDSKGVLRFLTCYYCYTIRNRYFHAGKAYPLFIISKENENKTEEALTRILLATIKDLIMEYLVKM